MTCFFIGIASCYRDRMCVVRKCRLSFRREWRQSVRWSTDILTRRVIMDRHETRSDSVRFPHSTIERRHGQPSQRYIHRLHRRRTGNNTNKKNNSSSLFARGRKRVQNRTPRRLSPDVTRTPQGPQQPFSNLASLSTVGCLWCPNFRRYRVDIHPNKETNRQTNKVTNKH